ncbi:c-type cytochrome [Marinobacterium mangrovicola]|uniref:Mono/diheme cytochrome c family protein n=1 Tax=Marinobacterium mangrovicola TaxID=1476959 RepID=A0A4R1GDN1_9GAMM|nr:cytochrome c [Marinobacterium mangrovicola]TCK02352.1 mono/diheme cytochrome c family protein [Marinobacterium mangrovicola]
MKRLFIRLVLLLGVVSIGLGGVALTGTEPGSASLAELNGDVGRGAYLARASGCIACHTNTDAGGSPLAGGAPLETAFGTFYAPNLTTDKIEGIGAWSIDDFARAVREGVSPEGDPYYPAFPYGFYTRFSDQDVADLWAAFKTVPPVAQPSKPQQLGFPFNIRSGLHLWQEMYFDPGRFQPVAEQDTQYNRGKFLVEAAGHCAACHTSRNLLGALDQDDPFAGAEGLPGGGSSPAIHAEALKQRGWSVQDLAYALSSGITPDGDVLGATMGEVIREGTAFLSDEDRQAIATYLLTER